MGLVAGICSRDQSDISEFLYKMTMKLRHRGDSHFCVCKKGGNGWISEVFKNPRDILSLRMPFGIVGRHLILDRENETIPYSDCQSKRFLLIDGRVFNIPHLIQELSSTHQGNLMNPSIILHLIAELQKKVFDFSNIFGKIFDLIEGMFAAVLLLKEHVFLFRDLIGIKPLYLYSGPKYIAFASEKKALWAAGFTQRITLLSPGRVVRVAEKGFTSHFQAEFPRTDIESKELEYYSERLLQYLKENLKKMEPENPFYLLLSGGIDSSLLAALLQKMEVSFNSLVIGNEKSKDILAAQRAADSLGLPLEILKFNSASLKGVIPLLIYHLESQDEKKLNIAFPLFYAANYIQKKKIKVVFTGQGADELFAGYERHETQFQDGAEKLVDMLWDDVKNLYLGNLQRDDTASMANMIELRLPYLTRKFIELSMQVPPSFKIQVPIRKYILRDIGKKVGLSEVIIRQRKKAIQFSSGSYDTLKKLARQCGFTKDFAIKNEFFSPTQLFIDSLSYFLGFPNIEQKVIKFVKQTKITWPDSFHKYEDIVNTIN